MNFWIELQPLFELFLLTLIPVLYRPEISDNPRINLCRFSTFWAGKVLARYVSMGFAYGEGWCYRVVWQAIIFCDPPYQKLAGLTVLSSSSPRNPCNTVPPV